MNTTGFYLVSKQKCDKCKQGFVWRYKFQDDKGKRHNISSVSLIKLRTKVLDAGLSWEIINEEYAQESLELHFELDNKYKY